MRLDPHLLASNNQYNQTYQKNERLIKHQRDNILSRTTETIFAVNVFNAYLDFLHWLMPHRPRRQGANKMLLRHF